MSDAAHHEMEAVSDLNRIGRALPGAFGEGSLSYKLHEARLVAELDAIAPSSHVPYLRS